MSDSQSSNSTSQAITTGYNKRNPYVWFAIAVIKLFVKGYSLKSTISACNDWSTGGSSGKWGCVVGAVDTGVSLGVFAYVATNNYITIGNRLAQNGLHIPGISKRDLGYEYDLLNAAAKSLMTGTPHSAAALLHANGSFVAHDQTGHPVFVIKNSFGVDYHMSTMKGNETHHIFRIATSQGNYSSKKRDEQFNLENFSQGGI